MVSLQKYLITLAAYKCHACVWYQNVFFCLFLIVVRIVTFVGSQSDLLSPTKSIVFCELTVLAHFDLTARLPHCEPSEEFELTAHMKAMESSPGMGHEELISRAFI